jgi:hypothetical protein
MAELSFLADNGLYWKKWLRYAATMGFPTGNSRLD